jgi:hypothetical protein
VNSMATVAQFCICHTATPEAGWVECLAEPSTLLKLAPAGAVGADSIVGHAGNEKSDRNNSSLKKGATLKRVMLGVPAPGMLVEHSSKTTLCVCVTHLVSMACT